LAKVEALVKALKMMQCQPTEPRKDEDPEQDEQSRGSAPAGGHSGLNKGDYA
jgi:hypothetical protein